MEPFSNPLKRIAIDTSRENSRTSSTTDPANDCPICNGLRFVTKNVPVDHPDFGKSFPCVCQEDALKAKRYARLRVLSNLNIVADKTFASFRVDLDHLSNEQQSALRVGSERARRYAESPEGWLLLQGNFGSGKTHLAAAIANHRLELGESVLFITAPDLLDHLRATYGPSSDIEYDEFFDRVRNIPLLVLDDLGAESATPWAQEKLFQLINHRYLLKLNTVITTNVDLDRLDPRIRSRLVDRELTVSVPLPLPDFRRSDPTLEQTMLTDFSLYGRMVFETWDFREGTLPEKERRNVRQAYETAHDYAQNPHNWLVFTGEHGGGKTHLAAAIANYCHVRGEQVILVTAPDLLDYLREAFNPTSVVVFAKRFYEIRSAPLLVIDHLDLSNATPWAREKIHQIADYRYLKRLPTVFTTTQTFEGFDPLLRSRLMDTRLCHVFAIIAPDYAGGGKVSPRRQRKL